MQPEGGGGNDRKWIRKMALASQVGIFFGVAVAIGWFIGQWLDRRLGTAPWLTALFSMLGVAAGFLELFRIAAELSKDE